jgi:hypothetical protein
MYTDKKRKSIFFLSGAVAGFLIYEEMHKYFPYMRRPLVIYDFATASFRIFLYMRKI